MKKLEPPPQTPSEFFSSLFGASFPGKLAIWTKQDLTTKFFSADELVKAERYCMRKAETSDVYFGVGLVRADLTSGRGKADDVTAIPGLWLDIDVGTEGHKGAKYPPDINTAWKIVKEFPVKPSLAVHSGYGLHVYWLFSELLVTDTPEKRAKAATLSSNFQLKMRDSFAVHGYKVDNTSDLSRVLRVVGTNNHKQDQTKSVRVKYPKPQKEESK